MRISGKFLVRRARQGKRGYYTDLVDLETGGELRLVFPSAPDQLMVPVNIDAVVEPTVYGRALVLFVSEYTMVAA